MVWALEVCGSGWKGVVEWKSADAKCSSGYVWSTASQACRIGNSPDDRLVQCLAMVCIEDRRQIV